MTAEANNSKSNALAMLLNKLDIPTLIMVFIMGGGNLLKTQEDGNVTRDEAQRMAREIHALHESLDTTQKRQTQALDHLQMLAEGQQKILAEVHRWQQNYKNPER